MAGHEDRRGATVAGTRPSWPPRPTAPEGAPNVLMVVLDDVGFAQLGCYGGLGGRVETPNIDRLAAGGLRYRNMHSTGICTASRASLLSGRNPHSVASGCITEFATGYPGYTHLLPPETALLPAILVEQGYNTMAIGKWHNTPRTEMSAAGPYDRWPLGLGFERFYGFIGAMTDQYRPDLWHDNHRVEPPRSPEDGYHLTEDLVDHAIEWINLQKAIAPSKPVFCLLALAAAHSPHQVPAGWVTKYAGRFDVGWDVIRAETLARQAEMGIVPVDTALSPRNPGVPAWDELTDDERRLFARQMEVFAAFLEHTDHHIGRLLDFLDLIEQDDNTAVIVLSDNGCSSEGGRNGLLDELNYYNGEPHTVEAMLARIDTWGGPDSKPHYATGWAMAGNAPSRWYKMTDWEGGLRVPFVVRWPGRVPDPGAVRAQFHHLADVVPTVLDIVGLSEPDTVRGIAQRPMEGTSMAYSLADGHAPTAKTVQYFEILGHRAIWQGGWKAVAMHWYTDLASKLHLDVPVHDGDWDADEWQLFHLDEDFSESADLAAEHPAKLHELVEQWWQEAERYQVLPLQDNFQPRVVARKPGAFEPRRSYTYYPPLQLEQIVRHDLRNRSHTIVAEIDVPADGVEGVIVADGSRSGGYTLCVKDDHVHYVANYVGRDFLVLRDDEPLAAGPATIRVEFKRTGDFQGTVAVMVNDRPASTMDVPRINRVGYALTEGLALGLDAGTSVWPGYESPFAFTGNIHKVDVHVVRDGEPSVETDAQVALYRD